MFIVTAGARNRSASRDMVNDGVENLARTLEVGKMPAITQHDKA